MKLDRKHIFDNIDWTVKKQFKTPDGFIECNFEELHNITKPIAYNRFKNYLDKCKWISNYREDVMQESAIVSMYVYAHTKGFEPYKSVYSLLFNLCWAAAHKLVYAKNLWRKCSSLDAEMGKDEEEGFNLLSLIPYFDKYKEFEFNEFLKSEEQQLLKLVLAGFTLGEINAELKSNVLPALYIIQKKAAEFFNIPYDPLFSRASGMFATI